MNTLSSNHPVLLTSLDEIWSFHPCDNGWKQILIGQKKLEADSVLFPILDAVESNSMSDICWLLRRRKTEIQVAVKFARLCADSVSHLDNSYSRNAATYAVIAANAVTYAAAKAAENANYAAIYAAAAATDNADYIADYAAIYAAATAVQTEKNKQFMILCLSHFNPITNHVEIPA